MLGHAQPVPGKGKPVPAAGGNDGSVRLTSSHWALSASLCFSAGANSIASMPQLPQKRSPLSLPLFRLTLQL